jgi:hypothetical protein
LKEHVDRSLARRIVLLLDCCYSGAFARGMKAKSGERIDLEGQLDGRGSVVLTASTSTQEAFEDGEPTGGGAGSIFTDAVIEGLDSGAADTDGDGEISIRELYDYVHYRVSERQPEQTPTISEFHVEGDLVVARRRLPPLPPLPPLPVFPPLSERRLAAETKVNFDTFASDPRWWREALVYDLYVPSFFDSNFDGVGDIRGVIEKLDYLQWLGMDAVVLSPLFPTSGRADGFDVTDTLSIDARYGTLEELGWLVRYAHDRGIRILADLVLVQTSDQHPWFRAACLDPEGPDADRYIFSAHPYRLEDAAEVDGRAPGWTFSEEAGRYYWHRRSPQEPVLNFDNPEELRLRPPSRIVDAELQRGREAGVGLVESQRRQRRSAGQERVLDGAPRPVDGRRRGEVVGELGQPTALARAVRALERLGDAQVQLGAPQAGHAIVERAAHKLVRELVGEPTRRHLFDHAVGDGLLEGGAELLIGQPGLSDHGEVELGPGDRGQLEQPSGGDAQPPQPLAHDLAHALRAAEIGKRARQPRAAVAHGQGLGLEQRPPELGHQERVAAGQLAQGLRDLGQLGAEFPADRAFDELGDLLPLRPAKRRRTTPSERRRSTSAAESASGTSASVSRNVVSRSARASDEPRAR